MEAVLIPFSAEQSVSPYQQMKTSKRQSRTFKTQKLTPATIHGGILNFPPPYVLFYSHKKQQNSYQHYHRHHQQQPPLLPLPNPMTQHSLPPPSRVPSCQKASRSRDQSLTPKKSKSIKRNKDSEVHEQKSPTETMAEVLIVDSTNRLGPEPSHLPKDISRVLPSSPPKEGRRSFGGMDVEKGMEFSGSAFTLSPPPSSVPLPKFSLRPKLSCNIEAAGIDAGATDNLRRLLRLR